MTGENLSSYITALVGDVEDALVAQNARLFEQSLSELRDWHSEITRTLAFTTTDNKRGSWLLLPEGLFQRSYLDLLSAEYYQLGHVTVRLIPNSTRFFRLFSYFYRKRPVITVS